MHCVFSPMTFRGLTAQPRGSPPFLACIIYRLLWAELNDWPWSLLGGLIRHQLGGLDPITAAASEAPALAIFTQRTYLTGRSWKIIAKSETENKSYGFSSRYIWSHFELNSKSSEPHDNQYFLPFVKELKQRRKAVYGVCLWLGGDRFRKIKIKWNLRWTET